ncbi:MAG: hypothetical protein HHJ13_04325, partial [Phycicoccus sp.]|nr:hypothetical protein [Phycicoccus sp.]
MAAATVIFLSSVILLVFFFGRADGFDADALICLAAIPLVVFLVSRSSTAGVLSWLMTPVGALLGFLWLSVLAVPILWALGLATPWSDYPVDQSTRIVATAIGAVALIHAGSLGAGNTSRPTTPMSWRSRSGMSRSLFGGVVLILVCFAILQSKIGVAFLVGNLLTKRDLLAGLGPLTAVAACTGVAGLAAWSTRDLCRSEKLLATACSFGYVSYLFVLGSRLPMVVYVIAIAIARASAGRIPRVLVASVGLGTIPFTVWYSVSIRKGQLISQSGTGPRAEAHSVIDPFVYGGLDVLHTFGAVVTSALSDLSLHLDLLLANAATMLPRSLLPGKPPGISVVFSERFFGRQWDGGSGVPPSITAELLFVFGVVGGLIALP